MSTSNESLTHKQLLVDLLKRKYKPHRAWKRGRFYRKFVFRSACAPLVSYRYFSALTRLKNLPLILDTHGIVPAKIHRPYLIGGLKASQRAEKILSHYQRIEHLHPSELSAFLSGQRREIPLLSWLGKNDEPITIYCVPAIFDREGELTLIFHFRNEAITSLSFSLADYQDKPSIIIAGLQGPGRHLDQNIIRDATKACEGIFPKRLLVETLMLIAKACHLTQICAVGDESHIFVKELRYRLSKRELIHARYNEFWTTLGGEEQANKLFLLPLTQPRKNIEDIASKKRAEYRRRYQLLDDLQQQIEQKSV
ncbi:VirK/YbjX family protein [Rosenbergiella metrosideri]|uniref:VirK/YbjX family protein n=1 Tax=Rosenbergiella metrosideri TaxID=2921185 RepID=UPI001F4FA1CB|nr:VirK/YbjX family protein [Rosenbergiella metrosideri]